MTRLMTTAVATSTPAASGRRWGLRHTAAPTTYAERTRVDTSPEAEAPMSFWEYYCLAFC
jgi:hypothetical protein